MFMVRFNLKEVESNLKVKGKRNIVVKNAIVNINITTRKNIC